MSKVLIIGSNGQLGYDLKRSFSTNFEVFEANRPVIDVVDLNKINKVFSEIRPDIVLNTAAYHQTEECEKNPQLSFEVNAIGAHNTAVAARGIGAISVFYSSDYVFDGEKIPYSENDVPSPLNVYGASKLAGEILTKIGNDKSYIIRTSWLFGEKDGSKGPNFVKNMVRRGKLGDNIEVVNDQFGSPTYTLDLASKTKEILKKKLAFGIYHVTNADSCSWYDLAVEVMRLSGINNEVKPISSKGRASNIKRPMNSVLVSSKLKLQGVEDLRSWKDALEEYLNKTK